MYSKLNSLVAVAPMLDWTDRHCRYFLRQISKKAILYSEMVVADAIIHGDCDKLLGHSQLEYPLVAQLGGSDPYKLGIATKKCQDYGYNEVNLNVGCPSDRVQSGSFGACLMLNAPLVADCIKRMQDSVNIPITIKHRTGIDYNYSYDYLRDFVGAISLTGCKTFIVHARNAVLSGLSPKQNREIPPLRYDFVYQLKKDFPELSIIINGGIKTVDEIDAHLKLVDGAMLGREVYYNPYILSDIDTRFYKDTTSAPTRKQVALAMIFYLQQVQQQNINLFQVTRHMLGLYHGCANARFWRTSMSTDMIKHNSLDWYLSVIDKMPEI